MHVSAAPAPDWPVDTDLVRELLRSQAPRWANEPLRHVGSGWDNETFRLGSDLAVRVPRREAAVELIGNEQRWVGELGRLLAPVAVPKVVFAAGPSGVFPRPWSVVRWVEGDSALARRTQLSGHVGLARGLGRAVGALASSTAADDSPRNPYRGVPLAARREGFSARRAILESRGEAWAAMAELVEVGESAQRFAGSARWVHGDLHPGNIVVARDGSLAGLVDFGDVCAGDPACDVATAWWLFDAEARAEFLAILEPDDALLGRARGWVALIASAILAAGPGPVAVGDLADAARTAVERAAAEL